MKTRLACLHINNVGSKQRTASFGYPFIIDPLACFNVVIAYCLRIVAKIVYYLGCDISRQRINKIIVVVQGLSLQYVAVVEKNHIVAVLLSQMPTYEATRAIEPRVWCPLSILTGKKFPWTSLVSTRCSVIVSCCDIELSVKSVANAIVAKRFIECCGCLIVCQSGLYTESVRGLHQREERSPSIFS